MCFFGGLTCSAGAAVFWVQHNKLTLTVSYFCHFLMAFVGNCAAEIGYALTLLLHNFGHKAIFIW